MSDNVQAPMWAPFAVTHGVKAKIWAGPASEIEASEGHSFPERLLTSLKQKATKKKPSGINNELSVIDKGISIIVVDGKNKRVLSGHVAWRDGMHAHEGEIPLHAMHGVISENGAFPQKIPIVTNGHSDELHDKYTSPSGSFTHKRDSAVPRDISTFQELDNAHPYIITTKTRDALPSGAVTIPPKMAGKLKKAYKQGATVAILYDHDSQKG